MKATLNQIVENLAKVLTDKTETAQYYSDNEQYICLCGWCGTMSPVSRPAYVKTFGKDTTEEAEAKAREIIAEKKAARQRTKYAQHAQEADRLEGVPAVGGFFWADNSGLKCDGGRGLMEELHNLNYYTHAAEKPARLCCVDQIINVSNEDFARPELADELVTRYNLQGSSRSEDVDEGDNTYNDFEKLATFYTVGALVVSPSGKYYLIDSEGYNYARYIYVPIEWPVMLADEVASVKAAEEARKAEEERQAAEKRAQRRAKYRARCAKWAHLMQDVRPLEADPKTTSRQLMNARKANILAMCRAAFPGVKFSLKVRHGWGADFELSWTDGPTVEEFNEKTDLSLFCRCRDTFNGWDDSTGVDYAEFADFARLTMGSNGGDIKTSREMSDEARARYWRRSSQPCQQPTTATSTVILRRTPTPTRRPRLWPQPWAWTCATSSQTVTPRTPRPSPAVLGMCAATLRPQRQSLPTRHRPSTPKPHTLRMQHRPTPTHPPRVCSWWRLPRAWQW